MPKRMIVLAMPTSMTMTANVTLAIAALHRREDLQHSHQPPKGV
ncbi:hypothetical protein [Nesterenkonia sp. HG001]|nr:hypothetical protein [Nesterenkonia sp. HG001]MDZ5078486.1 hypothetical protein [Nesterenkonia sp. HG001]